MSDLIGDALQRRDLLQDRLTALLRNHGYHPLETPLLEPTELFLRKSGGELASQLLSFTDPAGRSVSLRPELTAPAIRHFIEHDGDVPIPARWYYCGPVLRFAGKEKQDGSASRVQFTQVGAELLGGSSILADVELLTLAISALSEAGIAEWTLRLANLDVLNSLLDPVGLSDRARAFVVQNVPVLTAGESAIEQLVEESRRLHVVGGQSGDDYLSQAVQGLDDDEARSVLLGVLRSNPLDQLGQRQPEEVVERLLRKIRRPDAEDGLRSALELASSLARVQGEPGSALAEADRLLQGAGADTAPIRRLEQVLDLLPHVPADMGNVIVDFSLVRGLAYYNGVVFEVDHSATSAPIGGGGRYDGLARDLGGENMLPALGFAYNLDALAELSPTGLSPDSGNLEGTLLVASGADAYPFLVKVAQDLRAAGKAVVVEVCDQSVEDVLSHAQRRGFELVLSVDGQGEVTRHQV